MDGISFSSDRAERMESWIEKELAGCTFADERLGKRFGILMEQLSKGLGDTIPLACGDWAATKAAYRFLDNDRVSEQEILAGHFASTRERLAAVDGPILVLHDTTEFSFTRSDTAAIGITHNVAKGHKDKTGRQRGRVPPIPLRRCPFREPQSRKRRGSLDRRSADLAIGRWRSSGTRCSRAISSSMTWLMPVFRRGWQRANCLQMQ